MPRTHRPQKAPNMAGAAVRIDPTYACPGRDSTPGAPCFPPNAAGLCCACLNPPRLLPAAACASCDCADPTALPGLASDCACRCHPKVARPYDTMGGIIAYESGDLDENEVLILFSHLIRTGLAWQLQGCYGRAAMRYINDGLIDRKGNIL